MRYAITGDTFTPADAARLAANGVDYIQLRDKRSSAAELIDLARAILEELKPYPDTKLLINSRADVALAAGAHGVHLTSNPNELTPQQVRQLYLGAPFIGGPIADEWDDEPQPPDPSSLLPPGVPGERSLLDGVALPCLTSVSCHTLDEVSRAHTLGADLILFGPVFEKRVANLHITDGSGLDLLHRACRAANGTPVLALGGITHENTPACLAAGAAGIAAIRLFA
jgi:thiamine-phosphate pyrophosphorylase